MDSKYYYVHPLLYGSPEIWQEVGVTSAILGNKKCDVTIFIRYLCFQSLAKTPDVLTPPPPSCNQHELADLGGCHLLGRTMHNRRRKYRQQVSPKQSTTNFERLESSSSYQEVPTKISLYITISFIHKDSLVLTNSNSAYSNLQIRLVGVKSSIEAALVLATDLVGVSWLA